MAEGHEGVEGWGLADFYEGGRKKAGDGAGVEVEEVDADGYAEVLLAFELEGSVGQVGEREVCGGAIGFGEPA